MVLLLYVAVCEGLSLRGQNHLKTPKSNTRERLFLTPFLSYAELRMPSTYSLQGIYITMYYPILSWESNVFWSSNFHSDLKYLGSDICWRFMRGGSIGGLMWTEFRWGSAREDVAVSAPLCGSTRMGEFGYEARRSFYSGRLVGRHSSPLSSPNESRSVVADVSFVLPRGHRKRRSPNRG